MAQGELEKKIELNWLSALYGGLLTPRQRDVLRMHCEEDLSLGEIAQEAGISRQAVHVTLSQIAELGMIRFASDPSDKRTKIVVLTDIGEPMRRDAQAAVNLMTKRLAERIGQPQLAGLIGACAMDWGDPIDFEAEASA